MNKISNILEKFINEIYLNKITYEMFKTLNIFEELKNCKQSIEIYNIMLQHSIFNDIVNKNSPFIIYANHNEIDTGLTEIAKRYITILRTKHKNVFDFHFSIFNIHYTSQKISLLQKRLKEFNQTIIFIYHGVCSKGLKEILQFLNKNNVETFGYLTWETTILPSDTISTYGEFQKIIVPSSFNKLTFNNHFSNVTLLPHYWENTENYFNESMNNAMNSTSDLVFYMINNSEDIRKNFANTFLWTVNWIVHFQNNCNHMNDKPKVKFIIKGSKGKVINAIEDFVEKNNLKFVKIVKEFITRQELIDIHVKSHIFVSLTHGEGVGMTMIDAIKYGSVVIAPMFSGYIDYIGYNYPYYVETQITEIKEIHPFFKPPQKWAYVTQKDYHKTITYVIHQFFSNKSELKSKIKKSFLRINKCTNFYKIRNTYEKILFSNQEILEKQEL